MRAEARFERTGLFWERATYGSITASDLAQRKTLSGTTHPAPNGFAARCGGFVWLRDGHKVPDGRARPGCPLVCLAWAWFRYFCRRHPLAHSAVVFPGCVRRKARWTRTLLFAPAKPA